MACQEYACQVALIFTHLSISAMHGSQNWDSVTETVRLINQA